MKRTITDVVTEWMETFHPAFSTNTPYEAAADLVSRINFYISTQLEDTVVVNKETE